MKITNAHLVFYFWVPVTNSENMHLFNQKIQVNTKWSRSLQYDDLHQFF